MAWGAIYYAFSLFVVPMEHVPGWSRTSTNAALSVGLLVSGLAAYPVGTWIDHGHGRAVMVGGSALASAMLVVWSQADSLATLFVVWADLGVAMAATLYDLVFAVITRCHPGADRPVRVASCFAFDRRSRRMFNERRLLSTLASGLNLFRIPRNHDRPCKPILCVCIPATICAALLKPS